MSIHVRAAVPEDADTILGFIRALAEFEKAPPSHVKISPEQVRRHGFGERPAFECLIAELQGRAVGFALFFTNFSTWEGCPGLYLEDLFVDENARGHGVGRALVSRVARIAVERGASRLDFAVLDWNPARHFYARMGAGHLREWLPYRLSGTALTELAAG